MNTEHAVNGKVAQGAQSNTVIHTTPANNRRRKRKIVHTSLCKEMRRIFLDPRLWAMLQGLADRQYDGDISAAVSGMTIHNEMVRVDKQKRGLKDDHWLTRPLVQHADELESILCAFTEGRMESLGEYVAVRVEERAKLLSGQTA